MSLFKKWLKDDGATAAIEAGFLFPLLMLILCGTVDTGMGLVMNQKVINASHTICDLLARGSDVANTDVSDAIIAGQLALQPYANATYGSDIVSIRFVGASLTPTVQWRRTTNMEPNPDVTLSANGLGLQDEGVLAVTVTYTFTPIFTSYFQSPIPMTVVSYARSRKSTSGMITCTTGGATCS